MLKTRKVIFLIAALITFSESHACFCSFSRITLQQEIEKAAFIAHVKITDKKIPDPQLFEARVMFQTIEHFKGSSLSVILEKGVNTSCNMGITPGEEWVLFGYYDSVSKNYAVEACTPSTLYRNIEGATEDLWKNRNDFLYTLQKHFQHPSPVYQQGRNTRFYPDGKIESEFYIEKDGVHGSKRVYYRNGILMKNENFLNGKQNGTQEYYTPSGQLISLLEYEGDDVVKTISWYDTSFAGRRIDMLFSNLKNKTNILPPPVITKSLESWYNAKTGSRHSIIYNIYGIRQREFYSYNGQSQKVECEYEDDGVLKFESYYRVNGDVTVEKRWNEKGELISHKKWVKGKRVEIY